jgi:hypothetical protein
MAGDRDVEARLLSDVVLVLSVSAELVKGLAVLAELS